MVKPKDAPRPRSGASLPQGDFPLGEVSLDLGPESPMPQGQQEGAEKLSGG